MPNAHDLCARFQYAFRARHRHLCVNHTKENLVILSILYRAGFLLSITRGTELGPSPTAFVNAGEAQRRIWAELKYREDKPVLNQMGVISKPSKKIHLDTNEIKLICTGRRAQQVRPLGMGEIAIIRTKNREHEWLEAREALQLNLPGEAICRAI